MLLECLADFSPATSAKISWAAMVTDYDVVIVCKGIAQCHLEEPDDCVSLLVHFYQGFLDGGFVVAQLVGLLESGLGLRFAVQLG